MFRSTILALLVWSVCSEVTYLNSWRLQTSSKISATGSEISKPNFDDSNWYPVTVPATVMAGLLQNNVFDEDVFYSDNLNNIDTKQFEVPWWYRNQFSLNPSQKERRVRIIFEGLNYRANVWFNGNNIGPSSNIAGSFRYFEFDVSSSAVFSSTPNVIAVEVFRPNDSIIYADAVDLAITFVDWAPAPPDSNMGIWRGVKLITTGSVSINYPMVETKLSSLNMAHLTIMAELSNGLNSAIQCVVNGTIGGIGTFSVPVTLQANEVQNVFFKNDTFDILNVKNPALWWPWQMGEQNMYNLTLQVTVGTSDTPSDSLTVQFGIREATSELTEKGYRLYRVNGQKVLLRGGGWSPDLFLRSSRDWYENHFKYMKDMYLNSVRLEGKFEEESFYELADRYGILVLPGWCCCDAWQHWNHWKDEQFTIARESTVSQAKRLRIHPSILVFLYSSDDLPPPDVERLYLSAFQDQYWPNPLLSCASDRTSTITGPSGVKMSGPYSYVPPNYWELDTHLVGGAFGFLTEGGPGENPLSLESFNLTIPKDDYWPINNIWNFHCGWQIGNFGNLRYFTPPLNARYGDTNSAEDYLEKSEVMAYEGHRAMFEGYGRNKYTSTGVIQWMLNNPFPEMIWHLYDYYFNPSSTYFATKRACEPVHIQYSYDDNTIWIVNSMYTAQTGLKATAEVYDIHGNTLYQQSVTVTRVEADSPLKLFTIPSDITNITTSYFLRLLLHDSSNTIISNNFYWLSTVEDVIDWNKSTWFNTPCSSYADFKLLQTLPKINLNVQSTNTAKGTTTVTITNPSTSVAFFIHARVVKQKNGMDVWPIFWDDNYISLLPNESRTIVANYVYDGDDINVVVDVWNNISGGKNTN